MKNPYHSLVAIFQTPFEGKVWPQSRLRAIVQRVPQCSVLGPLLFFLYISQIATYIKNCRFYFYAALLLYYYSFSHKKLLDANNISFDFSANAEFFIPHGLILNSSKIFFLIFKKKHNVKVHYLFSLLLKN